MKIAGKNRCINCMQPLDKSGICPHCSFDENTYNPSKGLRPGTCLADRYFIGRVLGQGGFGITYVAYDIVLALRVAVKEYYLENDASRVFLREARIMSKFIDLPGIVTVRDYFQENNTAYLVMEYVNGIRISSYIKKNGHISAAETLRMMEPVIRSLARVHVTGYLHKDISANNIMITADKKLVLIDFGAARTIEHNDVTMTVAVKRGFSPEEQYRSKGRLGPWSDIYSLCATMYYMITGIIPAESVERVIADDVIPLADMQNTGIAPDIASAIDKGMAVMAADRYQNVRELYAELYPEYELPDIVQFDIVSEDIESSGNNIAGKNERNDTVISNTTLRKELDRLFVREKLWHRMRTVKNAAIILVIAVFLIAVTYSVINSGAGSNEVQPTVSVYTSVPTAEPVSSPEPSLDSSPDSMSGNTDTEADSSNADIPELIYVPDVTGTQYDKAYKKLDISGLVVKKKRMYSARKKNSVIMQSIAAGTEVADGTTIVLTVSKGKKPTASQKTEATVKPKISQRPKSTRKPGTSQKTGKTDSSGTSGKQSRKKDDDFVGMLN